MRRGTTQPIRAKIRNVDLTGLDLHLSFEAGVLVVKETADLTVTTEDDVTILDTTLTQRDTLSMSPGICKVQLRAFNHDGSLAYATGEATLEVNDVNEDGFLPREA